MNNFFDTLFGVPKEEDIIRFIANHLPSGRIWDAKHVEDTNIYKILKALYISKKILLEKIEELALEFPIDSSILLLPDWEKSVGLPTNCVDTSLWTLTQRRENVKRRIRKVPIVTLEEVQSYLNIYFPDLKLSLIKGYDVFGYEYTYQFNFYSGAINEKFILLVEVEQSWDNTYEYTYEFEYDSYIDTDVIECVLREVIPANVALLFSYVSPPEPTTIDFVLSGADGATLIGADQSKLIGADST